MPLEGVRGGWRDDVLGLQAEVPSEEIEAEEIRCFLVDENCRSRGYVAAHFGQSESDEDSGEGEMVAGRRAAALAPRKRTRTGAPARHGRVTIAIAKRIKPRPAETEEPKR